MVRSDVWLERLREALPRCRSGADPEAAHQVRVAVARLRVWSALHGSSTLDDDLRWLRRKVGQVRDIDVQLAQRPPRAWAARLSRRRARAQRRLVHSLDHPRTARVLRALTRLPAVRVAVVRDEVARLAARALRRGRGLTRHRDVLPAWHRLRRAVRSARYALELVDGPSEPLAELQHVLGDACDRYLAVRALRKHDVDDPAARKHLRRLERELERKTAAAIDTWRRARPLLKELRAGRSSG